MQTLRTTSIRTLLALFTSAIALAASACATQANSRVKLQETAQELNVNARFGRTEMALESVAANEREAFATRHKSWGGRIRLADTEMAGLVPKSDTEATVLVRVAWYRPEEQELRQTTVKQSWKVLKGSWQLAGEERADGDVGLLGEAVVVERPIMPRENAQFPTVRIGQPLQQ